MKCIETILDMLFLNVDPLTAKLMLINKLQEYNEIGETSSRNTLPHE